MYQDAQNTYSQAQVVTATAASTNVIDHGPLTGINGGTNLGRDLGTGTPIYLVVVLTAAMTDAGSDSTVAVTLETDDNAAFSSAVTAQTLGTFAALSPAGSRLVARFAVGKVNERYTQLRYTVANGNLTTGAFTAFLTADVDAFTAYADAYTVA